MSVFNRRSKTEYGVRCDWCGKIANNTNGEYERPTGGAGYIHSPDWDKNSDMDACEECAEDRCPSCGSHKVVRVTPGIPGPHGWGGHCESCHYGWSIPLMRQEEEKE